MRRVLIVARPSEGGAFAHVASLSAGLTRRGLEVVVAGPLADRRADLDVDLVELDLRRSVLPVADVRGAAQLARLVRKLRPDLLHAHGSKGGAVARAARIAYPGVPIVHTPHGYPFAGYFEREWETHFYRLAERALAPLTTRVICVCEAERRLATSLGLGGRARVVHNGVPPLAPALPHPMLERLRQRGPLVSAVTLLRAGKGVETLVDAMPDVLKSHPATNLAIVGGGSLRSAIEARIETRKLSGAVHLVPQVSSPAPVLAATDVFAGPSWAESFPYSILEAMAGGLPIVATDVGGTREAIEDGRTGSLVPPRKPEALAAAIVAMLGDRDRAAALGRAARQRAEQRFSLDRMIDGVLAVYGELEI